MGPVIYEAAQTKKKNRSVWNRLRFEVALRIWIAVGNCGCIRIPNMQNKDGWKTSKRSEIIGIAITTKKYSKSQRWTSEQDTKSQKLDKRPASDSITNELLRTKLPVIASWLVDLFNETETIPDGWTKATIILLHKKGFKGDIGNSRPVSLMSNI